VQSVSTNAALLVVVGGAEEFVAVCAGTDVPSTADVAVVCGVFVVTVVRGGGTVDDDAGVEVDTIVGELGSTVSTGLPDDADVGADESPPSLHPPTATVSATRGTKTRLYRMLSP